MSASDSKDKPASDEDVKVQPRVRLMRLDWKPTIHQMQAEALDCAAVSSRSSSRRKSDKIKMLLKENAALKRQIDSLQRASARKEKAPEEDADDPPPVSDSDAARINAVLTTIKALCETMRKLTPTGELIVSYRTIFKCYKGDQLAKLKRYMDRKTVIDMLLCQYGIKAEPAASDEFGLVLK